MWRSPLERALAHAPDGIEDLSRTGVLEVRGELTGLDAAGAEVVQLTPERAFVLCPFEDAGELRSRLAGEGRLVVDVSAGWAGLRVPRRDRSCAGSPTSTSSALPACRLGSARAGARPPREDDRRSASSSRRSTATTSPRPSSTPRRAARDEGRLPRPAHVAAPVELKDRYDVVIIGGGSHGLATAYYLAKNHGITDVAILEKSYIGSGAAGRNTTIIRANYRTPEGAEFYKESVKLYEGLGADLDFNLLFSQQGHLTLAHSDRGIITANERAEVNQLLGIDSPRHLPGRDRQALPRDGPLAGRHLARAGGALPPAGRDHPPRRGRVGLRARRRPAGRRDPPVHRGDRHRARERPRHRRRDDPRAHRRRTWS